MSALAAMLVGTTVAACAAPVGDVTIQLRGGAGEVTGALQNANQEAITLIENGVPRSWPWIEIAAVTGATEPDITVWQHLGTCLWRVQQRLERGDPLLALAGAKRARDECPVQTRVMRMQIDRALIQAAMQAALVSPRDGGGLAATATAAALDVCALATADAVKMPADDEAAAVDWETDFTTMMPPSLPPAFGPSAAGILWREMESLEAQIAQSPLASVYLALADLEGGPAGGADPSPLAVGERGIPAWAVRLLRAWLDACGPDAKLREKGRAALDSVRAATPAPYDPWIDYAIGRSLARDARGDEAALRLLRVAARVGERTPLGRAAVGQAAECLIASGDSISAKRLTDSLNATSERRTP